jgi:uncharacterized membrane protein
MRVPVLLEPRAIDRVNGGVVDLSSSGVQNYPALVELDFTEAIRDAGPEGFGWPKDPQGRLASFTLDLLSPRVVEYDCARGCPLVVDRVSGALRCSQAGDRLEDMQLPATFSAGLWLNLHDADAAFDASRNAVGTMQWVVRGAFQTPRLFFVYFDIAQNGNKPPPHYPERDRGVVDGLHFIRSGTDVLGFAPASLNLGPSVLLAQALFDNTTIAIYKYVSRNAPPALMVQATVNALTTPQNTQAGNCPTADYKGTVCLDVPQAQNFFFRVLANRPVIVGLKVVGSDEQEVELGPSWYPSADGGLAGRRFVYRALQHDSDRGAETPILVVSPAGQAQVSYQGLDDGASGTFFVDSTRPLPARPGARYVVTASRPVMVLGSSTNDAFGYNAANYWGAPVGSKLAVFTQNDLTIVNAGDADARLLIASPLTNPDFPHALSNVPLPRNASNAIYTNACQSGCKGGVVGDVWRVEARESDALLWAKAGEAGIVPIGGKDGMRFELSLQHRHQEGTTIPATQGEVDPKESRLIVMALYNSTRITVTNTDTGQLAVNRTLAVNDWVDRVGKDGPPEVPYGNWRVASSKPVAAYWYGPGRNGVDLPLATYYPAKVEPPLQAQGAGEFHGYAVGWTEKVKTASVGPGERARVKLTLVNLGRDIGAKPLPDTFDILPQLTKPNATSPNATMDVSPARWENVPSFESRDVTLTVNVPPDAPTGTVYQVNLTARSLGNRNFEDVARVLVTVQIRYEFTMRFLESNSTSIQKIIKPGTTTCMEVEVRNAGTGDVHVRLEASPVSFLDFHAGLVRALEGECAPGKGASLIDAQGRTAEPLLLHRGEAQLVTLVVTAPQDTKPLPFEVEVQGTAAEDASVRQQVSAVVLINVEAKIKLTALNDTRLVLPGENATYQLRIENQGDVETPITYGTSGLVPLGWNISFVEPPPTLKGRGSVDALGNSLDIAEFAVNVTAARDAPVAVVVPINIVATSAIVIETGEAVKSFKQSDSAKVTAIVGNNFTLDLPDFAPFSINPGEPFPLTFEGRNAANGNFSLRVAPGALPSNWTMRVDEPSGEVLLQQGDRVGVVLNITPPRATEAGIYEVGVVLAARDAFTQGARLHNFTIIVRRTAEFLVDPGLDSLVLAPGGQRELPLQVVNVGNQPVRLRLAAQVPAGYSATFPGASSLELAPGAEGSLTLLLQAPDSPAESPQPVRLTATDTLSNKAKEFGFPVQTARLDLIATNLVVPSRTFPLGEPAVVAVSVQNQGSIAANNVTVALLVDGVGVRDETLRALPPGEPRTITIPWTVDHEPRELSVVVDPDDKFAETDEGNNQVKVTLAKGLPGPEPGLAALLLALSALAGARLKPGRRGGGPRG